MMAAAEVSEWVQREVETDRRSSSSVGRPTETRNENTNELIACVLACLPHRERFETEPAISLLITSGKPGPAGRPALWSSSMVWSRGRKRRGRQPIMSHSHRRTAYVPETSRVQPTAGGVAIPRELGWMFCQLENNYRDSYTYEVVIRINR